MGQLVGKDSLAESDKLILEVAKIIRDDYLAQNGFSDFDKTCPFYKCVWLMKNIIEFYNLARKAIENSTAENKITWNRLKAHMPDTIYKLSTQKFRCPPTASRCSSGTSRLSTRRSRPPSARWRIRRGPARVCARLLKIRWTESSGRCHAEWCFDERFRVIMS